jgi:zinc protease
MPAAATLPRATELHGFVAELTSAPHADLYIIRETDRLSHIYTEGLRRFAWVGVCFGLVGCLATVRPPRAPSRDVRLDLSISRLTLANGMKVAVVNDPHASEVHVTMHYQVGAIDDPPAAGGMAHLVEHLMFEQVIDGRSLAHRLGEIASYHNAHTTFDATIFISRGPADRLRELLAIEALRVTSRCTGLAPATFERERDVVLNEIRYRQRESDVGFALRGAVFEAGHPFTRRIEGTAESVGGITQQQACAFVDSHYAPGKAVLVVSGNVTRDDVEAAAALELARVPSAEYTAPPRVAETTFAARTVEVPVPADRYGLVLLWPLPRGAANEAKFRALVTAAAALASNEVRGNAVVIEPGGPRAGLIGIGLLAAERETEANLINGADRALRALPEIFERVGVRELDRLGFHRTQHDALYGLFSTIDDAGQRDPLIARILAEGKDPDDMLRTRIEALRELTQEEAIAISRKQLDYDAAIVVTLAPSRPGKGQRLELRSRTDTLDEHRAPTDPADAHRPATAAGTTRKHGATSRTLANGLEVILLPGGASPIVDARLVVRAGFADEPTDQRGVAAVAARALTFDERHVKDVVAFAAAGGRPRTYVDYDHTTFAVRGMSGQLDFLLAGLRRLVRDGTYDLGVAYMLRELRDKRHRDDPAVAALRAAVYGPDHPYARAGHSLGESLTDGDVERFRARHYTPANMTLVVAGKFDVAIVDRWIDYLFADWHGSAPPREPSPVSFQPAAFATAEDGSHVELQIVFPASVRDQAVRLVSAQMLSDIATDVRTQLAASYDASAQLQERRMGAFYVMSMAVEAGRAPAAAKLLGERIRGLADRETAARAFVAARRRVLGRLVSIAGSPLRRAAQIEGDIALGRDVVGLIEEVRTLTVGKLDLQDLDLARAVIAMRGPAEIDAAFAALGRQPQKLARRAAALGEDDEDEGGSDDPISRVVPNSRGRPVELADPLTSPSTPFKLTWTLAAGVSFATMERAVGSMIVKTPYSGPSAAVSVGYRRRSSLRAGLQLGIARLAGTTAGDRPLAVDFGSLQLGPFVQSRLQGPFWLGAVAALRFESDNNVHAGAQFGALLGLQLVPIKTYGWLTAVARYDLARMPRTTYGELTLSVGLRR